jgi:hypothetical protein
MTVLANLGPDPVELPAGSSILAASVPLGPEAVLRTDQAVWLCM